MTTDLKAFVKTHTVTNTENSDVQVNLEKVHDGEWSLARKSEYKKDIFVIQESELYFEVALNRTGSYHSGYTYGKPKFNFVEKYTDREVSYPAIESLKEKALELQIAYFDKNDETTLIPVFQSGWVYHDKVNSYETVFEIEGLLLKQTMYGNSDWTEFVEYEIVEKMEEDVIEFRVLK